LRYIYAYPDIRSALISLGVGIADFVCQEKAVLVIFRHSNIKRYIGDFKLEGECGE
jgi:hypothetical protein